MQLRCHFYESARPDSASGCSATDPASEGRQQMQIREHVTRGGRHRSIRSRPAASKIMTVLMAVALAGGFLVAPDSLRARPATADAVGPVRTDAIGRVDGVAPRQMPPVASEQPLAAAADEPPFTSPVVTGLRKAGTRVDVFGVDAGQRIYTAYTEEEGAEEATGWQRSAQLNGGVAAKGTSVYGVKRHGNRMDIFAVGTDRRVWTAFWDTSRAGNPRAWQGWWVLGTLKLKANSSVHAVTSHQDRMDLFAVGEDRKVYTITWTAAGQWGSWTALPGVSPNGNTMVYGVSGARFTNSLDIFVVNTADWDFPYWNSYDPTKGWAGWQRIGDTQIMPGTSVFPVSRTWGTIDIFTVQAFTGAVLTSSWDSVVGWSDFSQVSGGRSVSQSTPFATSRTDRTIDLAVVGTDMSVFVANLGTDRRWSAWTGLGGTLERGTSAFIFAPTDDRLRVFGVGPDTGTYANAWTDWGGWGGWEEVGPYGQAGEHREVTSRINFGTSVDGWARLRVSRDGAWTFEGAFDSHAPISFNVHFGWLIAVPGRDALGFCEDKHLSRGENHEWFRAGVHPELAAAWPDIEANGIWHWKGSSTVDADDLLWNILTVLGIVETIIVITA
jgi:hypothetical protein